VLLGPSGCGKSTLLRLIAGFERTDTGRILLDGVDITAVAPHRRPLNMVFANDALFPHLDVEANVAFGLRQEGLPKDEIARRTADMLASLGLENLGRRLPPQLTAHERRRVALGRCLAKRPRLLLLDEPLATLDRTLREALRLELATLRQRLALTVVLATRERDDAMPLADRIALMDHGRLVQFGTPADIYERPGSRWAAEFSGDVNLFAGRLGADRLSVEDTAAGRLRVTAPADIEPGVAVWVAVRPERMRVALEGPLFENSVAATVVAVAYRGDVLRYTLRIADGSTATAAVANNAAAPGALAPNRHVWLCFPPEAATVLKQ
jgi:putrescine transport system ATP-binding protein